jgi:hypothetical protein
METEKKIGVFDLISSLFTDEDISKTYSDKFIENGLFMVNRRMAIKYPLQAQFFNISSMNKRDVVMFWNSFVYTGKKPESWVYLQGQRKSEEEQSMAKNKISKETINKFCALYHINKKDVERALEFFYDDMKKELTEFEKTYLEKNNSIL